MFRLNPNYGQEEGTIIVVRFETIEAARECHLTITALFAEIETRLDALYSSQNGEATLADVERIYAEFGFTNENGWHQSAPVVLEENEVIWPLDGGADAKDAENLLSTMEPSSVRIHTDRDALEDWQRYPHPAVMPLPDEEDAPPEMLGHPNHRGGRLLH